VDLAEIKAWRRTERERLIALRMAMPPAARREAGERITRTLEGIIAARPGVLGIYWPFRAEFDPRPLVETLVAGDREVALPVVIDKKGPLEYRLWAPGDTLATGVWDIPIPEKREIVTPSMLLAPFVGFDRACYRLGYGGGYFDRTLAAFDPPPIAIGVGFAAQQIETIYPQPFDIPMGLIVTETGAIRR
jgi:5-formyltetrahydrofolate cyclo-ligase